jgi:hypothetical protein
MESSTAASRSHRASRLTVPATSRVYTLRHAARLLGETEDTVSDAAISMFPEDGAIQIIDDDYWALASAFTDEGLENLRYIIDETRLDGSQHHMRQLRGRSPNAYECRP